MRNYQDRVIRAMYCSRAVESSGEANHHSKTNKALQLSNANKKLRITLSVTLRRRQTTQQFPRHVFLII